MATENVYEKSKLKIRTSLTGKMKPGKDKAKLVFTKDGVDQPAIDLTVKKEKVETEHVFAVVDDAKESYTLSYKVQYDTETLAGANDYVVWPLNSVIKIVGGDGKAVAKAPFELVFEGGQKSSFEAGDDGKLDCKLKYKSKFTVQGRKSITILHAKDGKDKGRSREYEVATLKFKIELPAHTKGTAITQYVNTVSANGADTLGHDKEGRFVKVVVVCTEEDKAHPDDAFFVQLTRTKKTKRTKDIPALLDVLEPDNKKPDEPKGKVKLGPDKKGRFRVDLGLGGGEEILLQVGANGSWLDDSIKFVNSRKLKYQMSVPTGKSLAVGNAEGWLKKVNVDILEYKSQDIAEGAAPAGTYVDPGNGTKVCILGTHNKGHLGTLFDDSEAPRGFHIALCDMQIDGEGLQTSLSFSCDPGDEVTWPPDGTKVVGFTTRFGQGELLKEAMQGGGPAVTGTWDGGGGAVAIPADHIYVNYSDAAKRNRLYLKMPPAAKAIVDGNPGGVPPVAGKSVAVDLDVKYGDGPYNGWSTGKHVVIALSTGDGARPAAGMNQTVVHEIGHMVNQAGESKIEGLSVSKDHGRTYTGRGHSGGHCSTGVSAVHHALGGSMSGKSGTCVMFGESADGRKGEFCDRCAPFVLAEPMTEVT